MFDREKLRDLFEFIKTIYCDINLEPIVVCLSDNRYNYLVVVYNLT